MLSSWHPSSCPNCRWSCSLSMRATCDLCILALPNRAPPLLEEVCIRSVLYPQCFGQLLAHPPIHLTCRHKIGSTRKVRARNHWGRSGCLGRSHLILPGASRRAAIPPVLCSEHGSTICFAFAFGQSRLEASMPSRASSRRQQRLKRPAAYCT